VSRRSEPGAQVDRLASNIHEGGSWVAVGPDGRVPQNEVVARRAPESAAPLSLIFGLVAVLGGLVLLATFSLLAIPILLMSAIVGLVSAKVARGSHPRRAHENWPGRGMALAGAVLSWIALVMLALVVAFFIVLMIVLSAGP
jgi:hypothetical protein